MVLASALRAGLVRDAVVCGRNAAVAASRGGVRRLGAAAAQEADPAPLYPDAVLKATETQQAKLGNGVRVATEAGEGPVASLTVSVDIGSRYETYDNNGVCSVIGASAFHGKEAAIAAMGGRFSQTVDREVMSYSATVLKADVPKAMAVLADAAKAAGLSSAEALDAAKGTVLEKLRAVHFDPRLGVMDQLHASAFLDTAMGMSTLGTEGSVSALGLDGAKNFYGRGLGGSRVVVAGAGAVHQGALTDLASSLLGDLPATSSSALENAMEPAHFLGSDTRMRYDSMPNAHVAFAYKGPPAGSEHSISIMMMHALLGFDYSERNILGVNAASKWSQELAELNLAAEAKPFYLGYKDTGLIGVSFIAADNHLDNFMWYTLHNIMHIVHKVSDAEVEMAKTRLKNHLYQQNSGCDTASSIAGDVRQFGRRVPLAEMVARIDAITRKEIMASANQFINDQDHALSAVGPIHELPDYSWIRRRSYWLRY